MTTESMRALAQDADSGGRQWFSTSRSIPVAVLAIHLQISACLVIAAWRACTWAQTTLAGAAMMSHAVRLAARNAVRLISGTTAVVTQLVKESLGFYHTRDPKAAAWRVLRHRQFARFFVGSIISNWGTWLQNTAQMLLAYDLTHSVLTVGFVTCAQFSTPLIIGPWAGTVADRIGARRTLVVTQVLSAIVAAVMALLALTHELSGTYLYTGAFAGGLLFTFALPAQSALIPMLVPDTPEDSKAAMVMNSVAYNAGRMVAPAFTVLIVATAGFWWIFALNAVTFAIFTGICSGIRAPSHFLPAKRSRIRDGVHAMLQDRKILILLMVVAAITLAEDPVLVLGPALARHAFHTSYDCSGYFLCALGAGSVLSSLLPRRKSPSTRRATAALGLLGVSILTFALAPWLWLSVAAAFSAGFFGLVAGSAAQAMLRQLAGNERALQVMGLWAVAWAGSKPFASLLDGLLPSLTSVRTVGVLMAIPATLPALILICCPTLAWKMTVRSRPQLGEGRA